MPRRARMVPDGSIVHVLNRGNCRMRIFGKPGDFAAFVTLLEQGRTRFGMRILGYCLMHNHWHLVLWPRRSSDLSGFVGWVCSTHVRRWREHRRSIGQGHLYQGRFKSFLVQSDGHLLTVLRYVEANPLWAKMVTAAQDWPWSSLGRGRQEAKLPVQLTGWPVDRPGDWLTIVNAPLEEETVESLRTSVSRGRPFGKLGWVNRMVKRLGLESTVRDPWRPRKKKRRRARK